MKRDLIDISDLTSQEVRSLLDLTATLKKNKRQMTHELEGKAIALIFQKPSNRTRVSFEIGIWQMGGKCFYLGPDEINLGKRESTSDAAKTLSRYLDAMVARTFSHQDVVGLAKYSDVPVINGLSDASHPCQALADIFSIKEKFGTFDNITIAYIGDGNNVCHSLLHACTKVGLHVNIATPKSYAPDPKMVKVAQGYAKESGSKINIFAKPQDAAKGAHVLYTDTWVSMGQEEETKKRLKDFAGYQIDTKLAKLADKDYAFMHCLPAHRGQEVAAEIIDGKHSIVFDQAENRLHIQKAILIFLLGAQK